PLFVDLTVTGTCKRRRILTRSGAKAGDALYVTGALGAAAAGLTWLRQHAGPTSTTPHPNPLPTSWGEGIIEEGVPPPPAFPAEPAKQQAAGPGSDPRGHSAADAAKQQAAGLGALGGPTSYPPFSDAQAAEGGGAASAAVMEAVRRFLRPDPRLRFGIIVGRT